jgi:L-alanine-DL-glutamate epimerase-like enolase superfamily enzyme
MGMLDADPPVVDSEGFIEVPHKPGLGYDIDRNAVEDLMRRLIRQAACGVARTKRGVVREMTGG